MVLGGASTSLGECIEQGSSEPWARGRLMCGGGVGLRVVVILG